MGATMALEKLGLGGKIKHVFTSEKEPYVRQLIAHNFGIKAEDIANDVMTRDNAQTPRCDIYTARFPCQPFSVQGLRQGEADALGRGLIAHKLVDYIEQRRPKAFILENVAGFLAKQFDEFRTLILTKLDNIKHRGGQAYKVRTRLLDSRNHGVPQSRPRFYIIGIRRDELEASGVPFKWPTSFPTPPWKSVLENLTESEAQKLIPTAEFALRNIVKATKQVQNMGMNVKRDPYVADVLSGHVKLHIARNLSPCLTASRAAAGGHFLMKQNRLMTLTEMMALQGIPTNRLKKPDSVSNRQLGLAIGNSFTVTVFERLLARVLVSANVCRQGEVTDQFGK